MADKRERGLYGRYIVERADGSSREGGKHYDCNYFVLDLTHDPHAIPALRAYAASARVDGYGPLADDLTRIASGCRDSCESLNGTHCYRCGLPVRA